MYLGNKGDFFQTYVVYALLPLVLLCCFVVVILPTTIATLILRIFWNDRMTACVLATSAQTICITPPSKVTVTSYLYYDQSAPHTSIAAIEFTRPPWLKMPPPQSKWVESWLQEYSPICWPHFKPQLVLENPQAAAFVAELERKVQEIKEEFTKSVHSITGTMNGNDGELTYPAFHSKKWKQVDNRFKGLSGSHIWNKYPK